MIEAYLALGSNLQDPRQQIKSAIASIQKLHDTHLVDQSSLFRTPPVGYEDQPDFINAVVKITTQLAPENLLEKLQSIENAHHRVREKVNGPRTLDIDILLYGKSVINTQSLTVPHPRMLERAFVIVPLAQIDPNLELPCGSLLSDIRARLDISMIQLIEARGE